MTNLGTLKASNYVDSNLYVIYSNLRITDSWTTCKSKFIVVVFQLGNKEYLRKIKITNNIIQNQNAFHNLFIGLQPIQPILSSLWACLK